MLVSGRVTMMRFFWAGPVLFLALAFLLSHGRPALAGTVLFDQGHGQQFLIEKNGELDLSSFAEVFRLQGATVGSSSEKISDALLSGIDVLIISGPFAPFAKDEVEALFRFVEGGGRLCVMLHVPHPVAALLTRFGLAFSNGVIREQRHLIAGSLQDFYVTDLENHALTRNIKRFAVFGGWAVMNMTRDSSVLARTSPLSWVDLNRDDRLSEGDAMQPLGVMVAGSTGKGRFVVFGDDAIFQNRFLKNENMMLARNLAAWLVTEKTGTGQTADAGSMHEALHASSTTQSHF